MPDPWPGAGVEQEANGGGLPEACGLNSVKQKLQRFCSWSQDGNVRGASSEGECAQGAVCRYVTPSPLSGCWIRKGPLWRGVAGPVAW